MGQIFGLKCPHCAAPYEGPTGGVGNGFFECTFCQTRFRLEDARPKPASAPAPAAPARPHLLRDVALIVLGLTILGGAVSLRAWQRASRAKSHRSSFRPPKIEVPSIPSVSVKAPPEERLSASFTHHSTVNVYGSKYVFGVVKNTSTVPIGKPEIVVVMRDAKGTELNTARGFAHLDGLMPGESSPVSVIISTPPAFASLGFETIPRKTFGEPRRAPGLRLESRPPERQGLLSTLYFKGRVENTGKQGARFVKVTVVALDAAEKIVGLAYSYASAEVIPPGGSARYEVMASFHAKAARYELSVEGRPE